MSTGRLEARVEGATLVWTQREKGRLKEIEAEPACIDERVWRVSKAVTGGGFTGRAMAHAAKMSERWGVVLVSGRNTLVGWIVWPDSDTRDEAVAHYRKAGLLGTGTEDAT